MSPLLGSRSLNLLAGILMLTLGACALSSSPSTFLPSASNPVVGPSGGSAPAPATIEPSGPVTELRSGCGDVEDCRLRPGTYVTSGQWPFMRGLRFTVPDGWISPYHALAELALQPPGFVDYGIFLSRDAVAVPGHRGLVVDPAATASDLAAWIAHHPDLVVSAPEQVVIGDGIRATTVVVRVAPDAESDDPGCPARACVDFIQSWGQEHALGMAEGQFVRLFLADIGDASSPHMLVVNLYAPNEAELESLTELAGPVLESIVVPDVIEEH